MPPPPLSITITIIAIIIIVSIINLFCTDCVPDRTLKYFQYVLAYILFLTTLPLDMVPYYLILQVEGLRAREDK